MYANPIFPSYSDAQSEEQTSLVADLHWQEFEGGLVEVGVNEDLTDSSNFAYDNETPTHKVYLQPYMLANRLVSNAEFQKFIDDGGYQRAELWLSDGWTTVQEQGWQKPLYWLDRDGEQLIYTLFGIQQRSPAQPVCHISGYEADAYANWAQARLPTEFEWEHAAREIPISIPDFDANKLHPRSAKENVQLKQMYGDCWQWTGSAYRPYPGFTIDAGAIGEYNGKFMSSQWVLRGSSCVTQTGHARPSYRNFFYPQDRWQFSGLRLARDL